MNQTVSGKIISVTRTLSALRIPLITNEYQLHEHIAAALRDGGFVIQHEARLGPRCRIDFLTEGIGIEIKRGKVEKARILTQLRKYADCEQVQGLILVTEKNVPLPHTIYGKPVRLICLNRLWGIAL